MESEIICIFSDIMRDLEQKKGTWRRTD
jgi:hypothetical protein